MKKPITLVPTRIGRALKASAMTALCSVLLFSHSGCTSDQVAIGLGAAAVGVVVGSEMSHDSGRSSDRSYDRGRSRGYERGYDRGYDRGRSHAPRCQSGYRQSCSDYYDYYGNRRRQCRQVRDNCAYYSSLTMSADSQGVSPAAETVAQKYGLSFDGAEKFIASLKQAQAGNAEAITELGLGESDVKSMARMQLPSAEGLQKVALNLDTTTETVATMISSIQTELSAQARDSQSDLWKSCIGAGRWSTPENTRCESTSWTGCSPETGASMCAAGI